MGIFRALATPESATSPPLYTLIREPLLAHEKSAM